MSFPKLLASGLLGASVPVSEVSDRSSYAGRTSEPQAGHQYTSSGKRLISG
jgi:hypothetical protein